MKIILTILLFFGLQHSFGQSDNYNLGFEKPTKNKTVPDWKKKNIGVDLMLDSITKFQGKYSLKINSNSKNAEIPGIENIITQTFDGKEIELSGYLKTENIQNTYIYLIIGDDNNEFSFEMSSTISGTTDWQKLNIKIPYTSESTKITIACNVEGSGEVWLDDFSLKIDNTNISDLKSMKPQGIFDSKFVLNELSKKDIDKLQLISKLWGFLKYYHPNVASGNYDWDDQLFQLLTNLEKEDFDIILENWVTSLGDFQIEPKIDSLNDVKLAPDFKWFQNKYVTANLKNRLNNIIKAKRSESNYYVSIDEEVNRPIFENEKTYSTINYEDDGIKLLALFRYWNYIEYFYPYKYLITSNWDEVLKVFIPKIISAKDETTFTLCIAELLAKTEDTHHILLQNNSFEEYFGKFKAPISTTFIDDKFIVLNSYTSDNKLIAGDIIQKIDGISISEMREKYSKYLVASNLPTTMREVSKKIIRTNKETIQLTILRGEKIVEATVNTVPFDTKFFGGKSIEQIKEISNEIGYLNTENLALKEYDSIFRKWQDKKAIIFDIRNYPKENFIRLLPYLHDKPVSFFTSTRTSLKEPGVFSFEPKEIFQNENITQFKGKIIVLVNNDSQSKSEFNALALSSYSNTIIIGNQTAGTDGDTSQIILPGNIKTVITGSGIYKLDKTETQKVGIKPDVFIKPTIDDIKKIKDVILEAAIKEALK